MDFLRNNSLEKIIDIPIDNHIVEDESGATAIEYGLIAALICVAVITALTALGTNVKTTFTNVSASVAAANKAG